MMSQELFVGMVVLFWVAELCFGLLVAYWFVTQGFDSDEATATEVTQLESSSYTLRSLAMWAGFFAVLILGIIVGA